MTEEEFDFANGTPIVKTDFTIDEESVVDWGEYDLCWEKTYAVLSGSDRSGMSHINGRTVDVKKIDCTVTVGGTEDSEDYTYVCSIPDCDEQVRLDVKYRQIRHDCESCGAPRTFEVEE